jgi:hypothetical protein
MRIENIHQIVNTAESDRINHPADHKTGSIAIYPYYETTIAPIRDCFTTSKESGDDISGCT